MVCRFGMSQELGPQTLGRAAGARFLELPVSLGEERKFSERTAERIDREVSTLLTEQLARARKIVSDRRAALDAVTAVLLDNETVEGDELTAVVGAASATNLPPLHRNADEASSRPR